MAIVVDLLMKAGKRTGGTGEMEQVGVLRGTGSLFGGTDRVLGGTDKILGGTDQGACVIGVVDSAMKSVINDRCRGVKLESMVGN